jgi:hypothetical protein
VRGNVVAALCSMAADMDRTSQSRSGHEQERKSQLFLHDDQRSSRGSCWRSHGAVSTTRKYRNECLDVGRISANLAYVSRS